MREPAVWRKLLHPSVPGAEWCRPLLLDDWRYLAVAEQIRARVVPRPHRHSMRPRVLFLAQSVPMVVSERVGTVFLPLSAWKLSLYVS